MAFKPPLRTPRPSWHPSYGQWEGEVGRAVPEEEGPKKYIITTSTGATHVYSKKPANWNQMIGRKQVYTVKGQEVSYIEGSTRTAYTFPEGSDEKARTGYLVKMHKGEPERAEKYFTAHAFPAIKAENMMKETPQQGPITYEGQARAEQIGDIRKWASARGARVETTGELDRVSETGEPYKIFKYKIISSKLLAPEGEGPTIPTTSIEQKKKEWMSAEISARSKKMYEKADPITKAMMHVMASVGPESEKYAGSLTYKELTGPGGRPLTGIEKYEAQLDKMFAGRVARSETIFKEPSMIKPKDVVIESLEKELKWVPKETLAGTWLRKSYEFIASPPGTIATTGVGGYAIGASAKVSKFASTIIGKVTLPVVAATFTVPAGIDIAETRIRGEHTKARGKTLSLVGAIGAGMYGYSKGQARLVKLFEPEVVDVTDVAGRSVTTYMEEKPSISSSFGEFGAKTKGKVVRGYTWGKSKLTGKKASVQDVMTYIPEQKITVSGRTYKVESKLITRSGRVTKTGKTTFRGDISEGVIDTQIDDAITRTLAGTKRSTTHLTELNKRVVGKRTYRYFRGSAVETTGDTALDDIARSVSLAGKGKAGKTGARLDVPRTDVKLSGLQNIQWVDVSIPKKVTPTSYMVTGPKAAPKGGAGSSLASKVVTKPAPSMPSLAKVRIVPVKPKIDLAGASAAASAVVSSSVSKGKAKVIPSYHESPAIVISEPKTFTIQTKARIVKTEQERKGIITSITSPALRTVMPKLEDKSLDDLAEKLVPKIIFSQPSISEQAQRQTTATSTETATDIIHIPAVPVPITPTIPTPGIGLLPWQFRVKFGKGKVPKYGLHWLKNPVPKTLKVKLPKIRKII